ncbi:MAG: amidohydrolase family protein, partial [Gammaproteobacteria bacterium]
MSNPQSKLVIRNLGFVLTGRLEEPLVEADTIVVEGDKITTVGRERDCDIDDASVEVDANGAAVSPGT